MVLSKRDEIIAAIRKLAAELGRAPSREEFGRATEISWHQVYRHFRGMRAAVRAAGLEPGPKGGPLNEQALVLDWARVVRELGRLPSRAQYDRLGNHHSVTLHARVGWLQMAHRFVLLVREFGIDREWDDVVAMVVRKFPLLARSTQQSALSIQPHAIFARTANSGSREFARMGANQGMRLGRVVAVALAIEILAAAEQHLEPQRTQRNTEAEAHLEIEPEARFQKRGQAVLPVVYGEPLGLAAMAHAPTNEDGVLFLFGALAPELGFRVERIQRGFPDCEAKREVAPGRWELQLVELELYSRNFKDHGHDPKGCNVIVCWKHNWPDVPEGVEVIELSRVVNRRDRT